MILWFDEIGKDDIAAVGGKGANLGEMARNGFPVPFGFCIGTQAYQEHIRKLELEPLMDALSHCVQKGSLQELEAISDRIRKRIDEAQMPKQAEQAIREAYRRLAGMTSLLVSVRSSATAEDLPTASFAGQQETFLSVGTEAQVLYYVKKCWTSLWTPRSVAYRQKNGFSHEKVALCVVVQAMVQSEKSGVLFTVNPLTGSAGEMMINASYGLGESIVSGRVTPDTFRISRSGPLVLERQLGSKETQIITGAEGLTTETGVAETLRNVYCLEETELRELLALGLRVESHYGKPQDIEWAIADGKLFLLQTRPITAAPVPVVQSRTQVQKMSRAQKKLLDNFKEHVPDAPYPLDYEPLLAVNERKNAVFYELGVSMPAERKMIRMDEHGRLSLGKQPPHPNIRLLWMPLSLRRMLNLRTVAAKQTEAQLKNGLNQLTDVDTMQLDNPALGEFIQQSVDAAVQWSYHRFRVYVFPMVVQGFLITRALRKAKAGKAVSQYDFLAGLDYKTAEIDRALYRLARTADEIPSVRRLFLEKRPEELFPLLGDEPENGAFYASLAGFLRDYGGRTMKVYTPFSAESWAEKPELLLGILAAILKAGNIRQHITQQENGGRKYAELKEKVSACLSPSKKVRFENLLEQFRDGHMGREEWTYRIEQCFVLARRGVHEAAKRLQQEGVLPAPEDIRYLTLSELKQALTSTADAGALKKSVIERKARRHEAEQIWNGEPADEAGTVDSKTAVKGLSGSPGIARGIVRVIHGPDEFSKLQKGEVLVCRFTDPVWTPLFSVACAVVCDTGGPLSHAAIVAREYGMPAVLGTKNATAVLKDGAMVMVDGSKGLIRFVV